MLINDTMMEHPIQCMGWSALDAEIRALSRGTLAVILIAGAVFYDISATAPHSPITSWIIDATRLRSIKVHAAGIAAPLGLDDPANVRIGVEHFASHCAACHGAPGVPKGDIARGLYPSPPDLAKAARSAAPPSFSGSSRRHQDDRHAGLERPQRRGACAIVAFPGKLPGMSEPDYAKLVMASIARGGHQHRDNAGGAAQAPTR